MRATFFLRQPTGIAIETDEYADYEEVVAELMQQDIIAVTRVRDQAIMVIPTDNIASVECK